MDPAFSNLPHPGVQNPVQLVVSPVFEGKMVSLLEIKKETDALSFLKGRISIFS